MKIVYCIDSICGIGGIQRSTVIKANALSGIEGNEVWVIVADNTGKAYSKLSGKVHFVDLAVNYYEDDWKSRWNVLKGVFIKRKLHRKRLATCLRQIGPDIVVSVGQSEKFLVLYIRGQWKTVREFHYPRKYRILGSSSAFDRILALGGNILDFFMLRRYDEIVVLTREDRKCNWKGFKNVEVIPNPVPPYAGERSPLSGKTVTAVGRLSYPKNYSSLVRAYARVSERHPDWTLEIYGDGEEREMLEEDIRSAGLEGVVHLKGLTDNVMEVLATASVLAVSSRFEGFSISMVEAFSCGVPVVSYDCPYGPRDLISEGIDGFLVTPGDEEAFADRLCRLIEDEDLRKRMGAAAFERSKDFSTGRIVSLWMGLFEKLAGEK